MGITVVAMEISKAILLNIATTSMAERLPNLIISLMGPLIPGYRVQVLRTMIMSLSCHEQIVDGLPGYS